MEYGDYGAYWGDMSEDSCCSSSVNGHEYPDPDSVSPFPWQNVNRIEEQDGSQNAGQDTIDQNGLRSRHPVFDYRQHYLDIIDNDKASADARPGRLGMEVDFASPDSVFELINGDVRQVVVQFELILAPDISVVARKTCQAPTRRIAKTPR